MKQLISYDAAANQLFAKLSSHGIMNFPSESTSNGFVHRSLSFTVCHSLVIKFMKRKVKLRSYISWKKYGYLLTIFGRRLIKIISPGTIMVVKKHPCFTWFGLGGFLCGMSN